MTKVGILALLILQVTQTGGTDGSKLQSRVQAREAASTITQESLSNVAVPLQEIDLSKIGHMCPKGRAQDKDYNELPIVDQLIANGKDSIPFLISKLEDETKIKEHVVDYWFETSVGDVAFIILTDFFTDYTWEKTTIAGIGWEGFLGCKNLDLHGEECFRDYISKYGRKSLKAKWQRIWDQNKDRIYWDEADRSFRVKAV